MRMAMMFLMLMMVVLMRMMMIKMMIIIKITIMIMITIMIKIMIMIMIMIAIMIKMMMTCGRPPQQQQQPDPALKSGVLRFLKQRCLLSTFTKTNSNTGIHSNTHKDTNTSLIPFLSFYIQM